MRQRQAYNTPEEFLEWVERKIGDEPILQELHDFHGHLRDRDVDSGTILGYLRKAFRFLDTDGELVENPEESTALRVYRDFCDESTDGDRE